MTPLQHHLHHRMTGERAVQIVELRAAGGADGAGAAQIVAPAGRAQLHRRRIEVGRVLQHHGGNRIGQAVHIRAHDFDGEVGRIFDKTLIAGRGGNRVHGNLNRNTSCRELSGLTRRVSETFSNAAATRPTNSWTLMADRPPAGAAIAPPPATTARSGLAASPPKR